MQVVDIRLKHNTFNQEDVVIAIGNFDGVHRGHLKLIEQARNIAKTKGYKFGILTFDVTPRQVTNHIKDYFVLTSIHDKIEIFEELGLDYVFVAHFNNDMAGIGHKEFVKKYLVPNHIKHIVCGFDFRYGHLKLGSAQTLELDGEGYFKVDIIDKVAVNDQKIASSSIHESLMYGNVEEANDLLYHNYTITGKVVYGRQKGRTIGFPTVNLMPSANYRIPQIGVYASIVEIDGKKYLGMTNIGHNPTFNYRDHPSIETHVMGFDEMIYGKIIKVTFLKNIRKEKVFESIDDLINQLNHDRQLIKDLFKDK